MLATLIPYRLYSASESFRMSKNALGISSDSRMLFSVCPLLALVENASSFRVYLLAELGERSDANS
jgi:hypothetical protein